MTSVLRLRGIFSPVVTPFHEDGALDLDGFESNLDFLSGHDLAGYLVLGSNGEAGSLDEDEKLRLVRAARRRAGERTLLVGSGLESTRAAVALTRKVADAGADAALVLTPSYYRTQMTADALRRHFEAVADASPIPVLIYSLPQVTGLPLQPALAADLSRHPRIAGVKESSGDLGLMGRILAAVPDAFAVECGFAAVLYPALCLGAAGAVLAVANCAPALTAAVYRAFEAGEHARARRLQQALTPLASAVTVGYGVAGLKAAMALLGLRGGTVRAPLLPPDEQAGAELQQLLRRAEAALEQG